MDIFLISFLSGILLGALTVTALFRLIQSSAARRRDKRSFSLTKEIEVKIPSKEALLSKVPVGIGLVLGRRMIWANPAMSRLIGYSPAEYRNRESRLLYVDDEEYRRVGEELQRQLSAGGSAEVESVLKRKDGTLIPSLFHVIHLSGESPDELSLIAITDISSARIMQEVLREKGEKYHSLFEELPVGIFRSTLSGRFLEINRTLASLFGYQSAAEMIEKIRDIPDQIYCNPDDRTRMIRETAESGGMRRFEIEYRRKGGTSFPAEVLLQLVRSRDGEISYLEGIVEDIRERKAVEARLLEYQQNLEERVEERTRELEISLGELHDAKRQLIESERMASLGSLMGGITHEINNPVGVALTASSYLLTRIRHIREEFAGNQLTRSELTSFLERTEEGADIINRNLEKAREFIGDIKQIAVDQSSEEPRRFNLAEYLAAILTSLKPLFKRSVAEARIECSTDLFITGFPGALSQVLTNLIINSLTHAFEGRDSGLIRISAGLVGSEIRLRIRDDGVGIPEENRERVWEAYFTTRREQGGSGLGLHIVSTVTREKLGGRVELESLPGEGCSITITIPAG